MADIDLLEEIRESANAVGCLKMLEENNVFTVLESVSKIFIADKFRLHWWTSLKVPFVTYDYGKSSDGLLTLEKVISHLGDAYLVVTDDEQSPWPVFIAATKDIIAILRCCRYFEYFVVAKDFSWIVFDTHANEIICAGIQ